MILDPWMSHGKYTNIYIWEAEITSFGGLFYATWLHVYMCIMLLSPLQLKILVEEDTFKVAVDGTHLLEYEHRVGGLEEVTLVRVSGDVVLHSAAPSMIWTLRATKPHRCYRKTEVELHHRIRKNPLTGVFEAAECDLCPPGASSFITERRADQLRSAHYNLFFVFYWLTSQFIATQSSIFYDITISK